MTVRDQNDWGFIIYKYFGLLIVLSPILIHKKYDVITSVQHFQINYDDLDDLFKYLIIVYNLLVGISMN